MPKTGTYVVSSVTGEQVRAFVPHPLPPDPPLAFAGEDHDLMDRANRALGRLDGVTSLLPGSLFIYFYARKEAVLSSQIEGTQSSMSDLLVFENRGTPSAALGDVQEVANYVAAMEYALHRIRSEGFPLSLRLIREIHSVLLTNARGKERDPGEFRRSQNWVGGTRPGNAVFVPPPPDKVAECMGQLEKFLHDDPVRTPALIKAGLVHVQFETIHPFLDGNGRIGRLLIPLLLCAEDVLRDPLLYLSLYFKQNRQRYYELLQGVRDKGDWLTWLRFFLTGVCETARQAVDTSQEILALFETDRQKIEKLGRGAGSALRLHQLLQQRAIVSVPLAVARTALSAPTMRSAIRALTKLGLVEEVTGRRRGRLFAYLPYLRILDQSAESGEGQA